MVALPIEVPNCHEILCDCVECRVEELLRIMREAEKAENYVDD